MASRALQECVPIPSEASRGRLESAATRSAGCDMSAGLRAATAVGSTSRRCCPVELGRIVVGFDAHGSSAFSADVVVLVSARKNEQELRPCRRRSPTFGAEQAGRLKRSEALLPGHRLEFYTGAATTGKPDTPRLRWARLCNPPLASSRYPCRPLTMLNLLVNYSRAGDRLARTLIRS